MAQVLFGKRLSRVSERNLLAFFRTRSGKIPSPLSYKRPVCGLRPRISGNLSQRSQAESSCPYVRAFRRAFQTSRRSALSNLFRNLARSSGAISCSISSPSLTIQFALLPSGNRLPCSFSATRCSGVRFLNSSSRCSTSVGVRRESLASMASSEPQLDPSRSSCNDFDHSHSQNDNSRMSSGLRPSGGFRFTNLVPNLSKVARFALKQFPMRG